MYAWTYSTKYTKALIKSISSEIAQLLFITVF